MKENFESEIQKQTQTGNKQQQKMKKKDVRQMLMK